jgi:endoglycosylceramidase
VPVGGQAFGIGTVTTLEAPRLTYPNGYNATVDNGWITSAPCAPLITVAAKPGAATVTVDVMPGGGCP